MPVLHVTTTPSHTMVYETLSGHNRNAAALPSHEAVDEDAASTLRIVVVALRLRNDLVDVDLLLILIAPVFDHDRTLLQATHCGELALANGGKNALLLPLCGRRLVTARRFDHLLPSRLGCG